MREHSTHTDTHLPDTCGSCVHFSNQLAGRDRIGHCRCWEVKGKNGDYARKKHNNQACDYYYGK